MISSLWRGPRPGEVLPITRVLSAAIIFFLVWAAVILEAHPTETGRLFAWPIGPRMSAMVLGAAYLSGVAFFARSAFARDWVEIALGFPPVIVFASTLGLTTIIHWDRFSHDHSAFVVWVALYFTTPFLVLLVWLLNRRAAYPRTAAEAAIGPLERRLFGLVAAVTGVVALCLFFFPSAAVDVWPWHLSPLTSRVMAATFALPAMLNLGVALDGRWRGTRIVAEAQAVALVVILISVLRARSDFEHVAAAWLFVVGLVGLIVGTVGIYVRAVTAGRGAS